MNREVIQTPAGKVIPPAPAQEEEATRTAQSGGFVALSAYALSLRDPELFADRFLKKPRLH